GIRNALRGGRDIPWDFSQLRMGSQGPVALRRPMFAGQNEIREHLTICDDRLANRKSPRLSTYAVPRNVAATGLLPSGRSSRRTAFTVPPVRSTRAASSSTMPYVVGPGSGANV